MEQTQNNRYVFLIYVGLIAAVFIAYEPVRHNDFVNYDDDVYITDNPNVTGGITCKSIIWAFTSAYGGNWHPLTWISHMLDCQMFGLNPLGHHLSSLLFHMASTLLLFWILKSMTDALWPSAFVAAAFALHPIHVESVAWAAERKDVLSGFFWILTMAAYLYYVRKQSFRRYLLVLIIFILGLMAKPMLVTLPFILLLLDYWPLNRVARNSELSTDVWRRLIVEKIPLIVLIVISSVITFFVQQSSGATGLMENVPFNSRLANAIVSYITYLGKMFYPVKLAAFYPHPTDTLPVWEVIFSLLLLAAISAWAIYAARRHRYLAVGWFWYLGTLVPVIGLVQVGSQAMADRYTYIPSIGIFILIGWGVAELFVKWRFKTIVISIASGIVFVLILTCTRQQVRYWQNSITMSEHAIAVTENASVMHDNLAVALFQKGRLEEAQSHLKEALRNRPSFVNARRNLGLVCLKQGKVSEAIANLTQAAYLEKDVPEVHYYLAVAYGRLGKSEAAIKSYNQALKLKPDYAEAHNGIGKIYLMQGNYDKAINSFNEVLRIRTDWPDIYANLGLAYSQQNKYDLVVDSYKKAIKLDPNSADNFNNLAWILAVAEDAKINNPAEAIVYAQRACELTKFNAPGFLDTLAVSYAAAGKFSVAVETAQKAIEKADLAGKKDLAKEISARLKLYQAGQPYIESATKTPVGTRQSDSNAAP